VTPLGPTMISRDAYRPLGSTGLPIPPLVLAAGPLGGIKCDIPESRRRALCVEWFKHVPPPVVVEASNFDDFKPAASILGHVVRAAEIGANEWTVCLNINAWQMKSRASVQAPHICPEKMIQEWQDGARAWGLESSQTLVAIDAADEYANIGRSPDERQQRWNHVFETLRAALALKAAGQVRGVGVTVQDWQVAEQIADAVPIDWITLEGCPTLTHHPAALIECLTRLAAHSVGFIARSIFHVGSELAAASEEGERGPLRRRSLVALCHGHGVTPVEAALQFALSAPGIVAAVVHPTQPDKIGELTAAAAKPIKPAFWAALKEERLIDADCSFV
jgi:hypothetical protein